MTAKEQTGRSMELRKVQLTGGSSLSMTLPKAWVEATRVHQGDLIGCLPQADGSLLLYPHAKNERALERYEVDLTDTSGEYVFRKIIAAYLMGYDIIALRTKGPIAPKTRLAARHAVRRITGLEIIEEEPNVIVVQDFLDPREFHLEKALRRMSLLTHAMQDEAILALETGDPAYVASILERDDEVDRLYWLVTKQYHMLLRDASLSARMEMTATQALNYLLVARLVERTADHAARIATQGVAIDRKVVPEALVTKTTNQARKAIELFKAALVTFTRKDAKRANALIDETNALRSALDRLLRDAASLGGEPLSHLAYVIESVGRTGAYAADVSEVAINHKVATD